MRYLWLYVTGDRIDHETLTRAFEEWDPATVNKGEMSVTVIGEKTVGSHIARRDSWSAFRELSEDNYADDFSAAVNEIFKNADLLRSVMRDNEVELWISAYSDGSSADFRHSADSMKKLAEIGLDLNIHFTDISPFTD